MSSCVSRIILWYDSLVVGIGAFFFFSFFFISHVHVNAKDTLAPGENLLFNAGNYLELSNTKYRLRFMQKPAAGGSTFISWYLCIQSAWYYSRETPEDTTFWVGWQGKNEYYSPPDLLMSDEGKLLIIYAAAAPPAFTKTKSHHKKTATIAALTLPFLLILAIVFIVCYINPTKCCFSAPTEHSSQQLAAKEDDNLPFFNFKTIQMATNYFSNENKLGQGGFGPVYKGILPNGQEIAAKRLSKISGQGIEQFKNEVLLISKLQHRNLVRLLGCCTHGDERILIYEYLPNKSLDSILFDEEKKVCLDWRKRVSIIDGIAQGLLYLHKYSRMRIIHRDLKTSNILLDIHMHPKISDFGTARIFKDNVFQASTKSIIGTYGYMSPEYAMNGCFSEKSDVFSFGVMVMEIVSGKRNNDFYNPNHVSNLLGYVWDMWIEGRISDLIDPTMEKTISIHEATRCIQVCLLCVQDNASDRPTMSEVVSMLGNESTVLLTPKQPGFSTVIGLKCVDVGNNPKISANMVTISDIEGR